MLLTDKIMVPVTARNINHYRDKGYNAGYKVLRIKANSRDILPNKEQIKEAVDCLVKGNRRLVFIDMNN